MQRTVLAATLAGGLLWVVSVAAAAQEIYPEAARGDDAGFERIFDGKTLDGWEGDPQYWRVENGSLVGEVTPESVMKRNAILSSCGVEASRGILS